MNKFDAIALFTNNAICVRVCQTRNQAWAVARQWSRRGIEDQSSGVIICPSAIAQIDVRPHDPERWKPKEPTPQVED